MKSTMKKYIFTIIVISLFLNSFSQKVERVEPMFWWAGMKSPELQLMVYGENIDDHETLIDEKLLNEYKEMLSEKGFKVVTQLGFGKPNKVIPEIINKGEFDILVMGTHGHTGFKDLVFGTTVDKLRHKIFIPLLIVKN